jgi:hypothetical protein
MQYISIATNHVHLRIYVFEIITIVIVNDKI